MGAALRKHIYSGFVNSSRNENVIARIENHSFTKLGAVNIFSISSRKIGEFLFFLKFPLRVVDISIY